MRNYYKEFMVYANEGEDKLVMYRGLQNLKTLQYCVVIAHYIDPNADDYEEVIRIIDHYNGQDFLCLVLDRMNGEFAKKWYSSIEESIEQFEYIDDAEEDEEWDAITEEGLK